MSSSIIENGAVQDALLIALHHLSVKDIISLSQTCKALRQTCMAKQLWLHVWRRDILQENLPRPKDTCSLDTLNDLQMKALVMHTLRLHREMTCPPEQRVIQRVTLLQSRPITWTRIVRGTWLLVAMSDAESSVLSLYSIQSLLGTRSQDLLAQAFLSGPVLNGLVEVSSGNDIMIALELRTERSTLEMLSIRHKQNSLEFVRIAKHDGISHIRALHGSSLGFALHEDLSVPAILNWRTGAVTHLCERPDTDGGTVAMILNDEHIGFLTPRKLHILGVDSSRGYALRLSPLISFVLDKRVRDAKLAFCDDGRELGLRVLINNSDGIYLYFAPVPHPSSARRDLQLSLLWSREWTPKPPSPFRLITQSLSDHSSSTISWVECAASWRISRSLPAISQFVTIAQDLSTTHSSLQDPPRFELSERSMPALYATNDHDYDQGLGLLAIGNIIGEFVLYSFSGGAFGVLQGILQTPIAPPWNGEEILPQTSFTPYPPRSYTEEPDDPDVQRQQDQAHLELWNKYWPKGLEAPKAWFRCSPSDDLDKPRFFDVIGNEAWELEYGSHFLGRVIPLLRHEPSTATLLTVGGLFLVYHANNAMDQPFFAVLNPELTLAEIVTLLPEEFGDWTLGGAVVGSTVPDWSPKYELDHISYIGTWEQRHGIKRWHDFRARGGKGEFSDFFATIQEEPRLHHAREVRCTDRCPLCA